MYKGWNRSLHWSKTIWVQPIVPVNIGEGMRLLAAMEWIIELSFTNVVFPMHSKIVVDVFMCASQDITVLRVILSKCRSFLNLICNNYHIKFIRRKTNMVALFFFFLQRWPLSLLTLIFILTFQHVLIFWFSMKRIRYIFKKNQGRGKYHCDAKCKKFYKYLFTFLKT